MDEDITILANMLVEEMQKKGLDIKSHSKLTIWLEKDQIEVESILQGISVRGKFEGGMKIEN